VELGYDVHLIVQEQIVEEINDKVMVYVLPFRRPWGGILNAVSLRILLKKIKPDLLHVFAVSQDGLLGSLSSFHPSIVSVLGSDVFNVPYQSWLKYRIVKKNLQYYDWIGSTSHVMAKQILKLHPNAKNISITPFGVDTQVFASTPSIRNKEYITIGTVKTMHSNYGIDLLLQSFANALEKLSETNPVLSEQMRLLIVGAGPQLAEYQNLARELNIERVVKFTGYVPNRKVPKYLSEMDIFVALSRNESFGVAILEASACNLPVIVSNIGGLLEVVQDGVTGFIVESENVPAATDAMMRLIQDDNLRKKMGQAGREYVQSTYEWSKCVEIMGDIYRKVLHKEE
jgi:glycosyltransferase involved in cell wall biosynthesis